MELYRTLFFAFIFTFPAANACPPGWNHVAEWCYLFSHNQVTWAEAEVICQTLQGFLAEPESAAIDHVLASEALRTGRKYWLGGSDIEQEGTFLWTTKQTPFTYTNWIPGDPNNAGAGEDCLLNNWNGDGKWADGDCEWKEYYVCQKENDNGQNVIG